MFMHLLMIKKFCRIHTPSRSVWGAGFPANRRYIHVELCETNNQRKFAQSVNNDAIYIASLLHKYHLKPSCAVETQANWSRAKKRSALEDVKEKKAGGLGTICSHHEVSDLLGNTTHVDPDHYFVKFGYSMQQFYDLVCQYYYGRNYQPSMNERIF